MTHQQQTTFEIIVGKGEIAHNEKFLPFPQYFLLKQMIVSPFVHIFDIISLFAAELEEPKIGMSGKGLSLVYDQYTMRKGGNAAFQQLVLPPPPIYSEGLSGT